MVFGQVRALPIDLHVAVAADAKHKVILASTLWPLAKVMTGCRKPPDVGWVDRAQQRMLSRPGEHRAGNHKHILSGESFS